jgi:hypothetical protein
VTRAEAVCGLIATGLPLSEQQAVRDRRKAIRLVETPSEPPEEDAEPERLARQMAPLRARLLDPRDAFVVAVVHVGLEWSKALS